MEKQDVVNYQGEEYDIPTGLTEGDVRASMGQIYPSAGNAKITKVTNDDGTSTWNMTESGGDKGSL